MPEHRLLSRFLYLFVAAALLTPLPGVVAEESLESLVDTTDGEVTDITVRSADARAVGEVTIFLLGKPQNVRAKRATNFKVTAVDGDGILIRDAKLEMDFDDGKLRKTKFDRKVDVEHTWKKPGSYQVNFTLVDRDDNVLARGRLRVRVDKALRFSVEIVGDDAVDLEDGATYRFMVFSREARAAKASLMIDWGDGTTETINNFRRSASRSHTYADEGTYKIRATYVSAFGETKKSPNFTIEVKEGGGTIDLSKAQVAPNADRDIENYRVTSTVTGVTVTRGMICIFHTKAGRWPVRDGLEGNPWVAVFYQGRLHAGTYEWLRPGQTCKSIDAAKSGGTHRALGPHIAAGPLTGWVPKKGEEVWFFTSTHARLNIRSSNERAEPFLIIWPF